MLDGLLDSLVATVLFALAQLYLVQFIRALPWKARWKTRKPLSCDACMTSWVSFVASPMWLFTREMHLWTVQAAVHWGALALATTFASMGLCLLLLRRVGGGAQAVLLPPPVDEEVEKT